MDGFAEAAAALLAITSGETLGACQLPTANCHWLEHCQLPLPKSAAAAIILFYLCSFEFSRHTRNYSTTAC
jgi:hypothetical protein